MEKIRKINPNLKVVMMSAFGDAHTKKRAKELGVSCFMDKPFDIKKLVKVIREVKRDFCFYKKCPPNKTKEMV